MRQVPSSVEIKIQYRTHDKVKQKQITKEAQSKIQDIYEKKKNLSLYKIKKIGQRKNINYFTKKRYFTRRVLVLNK